jgi:hypothetical protein
MVGGHTMPLEVGQPSRALQSSPCARSRGSCPIRALSPRLMIGKEYRWVTPTHPSTGVLAPKKVTIRRQLVVQSSSSDHNLPLVKHDARVDLNPGSTRIRYTLEPTLMSDSPLLSLPCNIVSGQWVGAGYRKVLIPNPDYKGKGRTKSAR